MFEEEKAAIEATWLPAMVDVWAAIIAVLLALLFFVVFVQPFSG